LKTEIVGHDFIEFADDYELQTTDLKPRVEDKSHSHDHDHDTKGGFQQVPNTPNTGKA